MWSQGWKRLHSFVQHIYWQALVMRIGQRYWATQIKNGISNDLIVWDEEANKKERGDMQYFDKHPLIHYPGREHIFKHLETEQWGSWEEKLAFTAEVLIFLCLLPNLFRYPISFLKIQMKTPFFFFIWAFILNV